MVLRDNHRDFLMGKPSVKTDFCAVCGRPATNLHHVIPKGMGCRSDKGIPLIRLCGSGVTGCHGLAHKGKLHFGWDDDKGGWVYYRTEAPMNDWQCWEQYRELYAPLPGWRDDVED